jgi:hypothetical protein
MSILSNMILDADIQVTLKADMCGCSECGWKGKCSDCETEEESDGWESPIYTIHLCPKCEDGGVIDDYWYSDGAALAKEKL